VPPLHVKERRLFSVQGGKNKRKSPRTLVLKVKGIAGHSTPDMKESAGRRHRRNHGGGAKGPEGFRCSGSRKRRGIGWPQLRNSILRQGERKRWSERGRRKGDLGGEIELDFS